MAKGRGQVAWKRCVISPHPGMALSLKATAVSRSPTLQEINRLVVLGKNRAETHVFGQGV